MNYYKMIYPLFKSLAFKMDPEFVHELTINTMNKIGPFIPTNKNSFDFKVSAFGLNFSSPIGLAAGLDKNAMAVDFLSSLPFGFLELGTITPVAQAGNDRPRLFRYIEEESLRNRMGFNNEGADVVVKNLSRSLRRDKIIGINLGKNKSTANELAFSDYAILYKKFAKVADYLVINVSSPNTPGLRDLLSESGLREIFEATNRERKLLPKPLFVKVSPDMDFDQLKSVVLLVKEFKLTGIIATNTSIMVDRGEGGVSGKLIFEKSKLVREFLLQELKSSPEIELIGVGGFSNFEQVKDYWISGGKLVQIYSSFIFQGPEIVFKMEEMLKLDYERYKVSTFDDYLKAIR